MAKAISSTLEAGIHLVNKLSGVLGIGIKPISHYAGLLTEIDKVEKFKGKAMAIKLWKYWYNCMCRAAMQEPNTEEPPYWIKKSRQNNPSILIKHIREISKEKDINRIRLILSIFRSFESARVAPVDDLSTILCDSQGPSNFENKHRLKFIEFLNDSSFAKMVKEDLNKLLVKRRTNVKDIPFHYTVKSGISGSSMGTAITQTLLFDNNQSLKEKLNEFSNFFHEESLEDLINFNRDAYDYIERDLIPSNDLEMIKKCPGRIAFIPANGGKTRCVAIGNYWIQNTLKPLHSILFEGLRHIAMDGTYDQHSQSSMVAKATTEGPVWSYDLTAATDRLPLNIQIVLMEFFFAELGHLWGEILKEISFCYKGKCIKYKVGQPMGLYSSWASLALVHHFIIQYCSYLVGIRRPFVRYSVLGDDVAIWNKAVAEKYEEIIYDLGVTISKAKSYIPKGDQFPWKAEFAKRLFLNGIEISGIAPDVLNEGFKSLWCIPELFNFLVRHGFNRITEVPFSRVVNILRLKPKSTQQLLCAFRVNEILGGICMSNIDLPMDAIIAERLSNLTIELLMSIRVDELTERFSDISSDLYDDDETNRVVLEKHLGGWEQLGEALVYNRILKDRIDQILELSFRMIKYLPSGEEDSLGVLHKVKLNDEVEYEDNILTKFKDIEYLPTVKLEELIKGLTLHKDKKQYRVLYLKRLTKRFLESKQTADDDDW